MNLDELQMAVAQLVAKLSKNLNKTGKHRSQIKVEWSNEVHIKIDEKEYVVSVREVVK